MRSARRLLLLALPILLAAGCGRGPGVRIPAFERPPALLSHPAIDAAAEELAKAASAAVGARLAPDAKQRLLLAPLASRGSEWEASALTWALAGRDGRLRPYPTDPSLASVPAIQAWLREGASPAVAWVVESSGGFASQLRLVAVSANAVWRSAWVEALVPASERWTWPLSEEENPPVARVLVGEAERLTEDEGRLYVQSRSGLREIQWRGGRDELRLGEEKSWESVGRSWITRNVGLPADPSPAVAVLKRDLRLELRDADLPRGEGDLWSWSISRGGAGLSLPLVRADVVEVLGIAAAPSAWALEETWLVLRRPPDGPARVEMFKAPLRRLPRPPVEAPDLPPEPLRVVCDLAPATLALPFGLPPLAGMEATHQRPRPLPERPGWLRYDPLFAWLAPVELRPGLYQADWAELRTAESERRPHLVRFTALDDEFPLWRASLAQGPLVLGDRARWKGMAVAPLYGVARVDPALPAPQRRALAAWLARQDALSLFGLERPELAPRLPLSGRPRPIVEEGAGDGLPAAVGLDTEGRPGLLDPLPPPWREEAQARLKALLGAEGVRLEAAAPRVSVLRLLPPEAEGAAGVDSLLAALDLRDLLRRDRGEELARPDLDEEAYVELVEGWLLSEGHLVPLWTEPGVVFVDRRVAGLRPRPRAYLPDLREAHLLPASALAPFDLRP